MVACSHTTWFFWQLLRSRFTRQTGELGTPEIPKTTGFSKFPDLRASSSVVVRLNSSDVGEADAGLVIIVGASTTPKAFDCTYR